MAVAPRSLSVPISRGPRGSGDERLVARVTSGDDQAFEEIFDRYGPALLSFCVHMLGSREWGEDALQLTFVAAYKALRRGECDGALRPWLYAIARNRCLSELRSRREIPDSDSVSADCRTIDGPASLVARREQLREIVEDIHRLPADQRAALVLFELGDQSHEEIAAELGVRRDKVKALIFQARERLLRGRVARERACSEVREGLANARGKVPARGLLRAHIDRCEPCQEFEREVRRQRAALALILPVVLSGKVKALVLSSAAWHSGAGAGVTAAGGAGSLAGASSASSGAGTLAGSAGLGSGAAASGGSLGGAGAAAGGGALSVAAGSAAPAMVASAIGDAVAGVGALTSSISVATVAKLAAVVAVAVGIGGVTRSALEPSSQPQVSFRAGQPRHVAPLRSPFQALVSPIKNPLAGAKQPRSRPGVSAAPFHAAWRRSAAGGGASSPIARPSSSANLTAVSAPSTPAIGTTAPTGRTSSPASSPPGNGSAIKEPSSGSFTTTTATTTTAASSPTSVASSSGSPASPGPSAASPGNSGNSPGHSNGQGQSSAGEPGANSNGNGPPSTPPGCEDNPSPGCAKKTAR